MHGNPAAGLQDQLAPPVDELLVLAAMLAAIPLRGSQRRQERQRPDPPGQGYRHQAQPAQAAGLHEVAVAVAVAGADRVPVDAFGADALAAPTLDGVYAYGDGRLPAMG